MEYVKLKEMNSIELAINAKNDIKRREELFIEDIARSLRNAYVIDQTPDLMKGRHGTSNILVTCDDVVTTIFNTSKFSAVINMCDFMEPGGGYLKGQLGFEESICQESFLYNVLQRSQKFYNDNTKEFNNGEYANRMAVIKGVEFERGAARALADIICITPPDKNKLVKNGDYSDEDLNYIMESRIKFLLYNVYNAGYRDLIIGAFGCGYCGYDTEFVADLFRKYLLFRGMEFNSVTFSIVGRTNSKYLVFKKTFGV